MFLRQIFDPWLAQYAYLIGCPRSGEALVIDPERDIDQYRNLAEANDLRITAVAETHIHADFVSGAREFAQVPEMRLYLSAEGGEDWNYRWPGDRPNTHFLRHGDTFKVGNIKLEAIHTPGHTPEHLCYLITDGGAGVDEPLALVTGDFLFVGDVGRPDLLESAAGMKGVMKESAKQLRASLADRLAPIQDWVLVLPAHGAGSACGKSLGAVPVSTIGYERMANGAWKTARQDGEQFVQEILAGQPEPPLYFKTMKRLNRDGAAVTNGPPSIPKLGSDEFNQAAARCAVVVDARDDIAAFAKGHFAKALHAPLHSPLFSAGTGSVLDENDEILLVVESPDEVGLAVRQLCRIGFDHVKGWITQSELEEMDLAGERLERVQFGEFDSGKALEETGILDVRTSAEFDRGHIEGAQSIPYTRLKERLDEVPRDKQLYIHCGSGKRAGIAASYLAAQGFSVVHVDGICERCREIAELEGVAH